MRKVAFVGAAVCALGFSCLSSSAIAQTAPSLGTVSTYAVLAGQTVTNTGSTTITGDIGGQPWHGHYRIPARRCHGWCHAQR